MNFQRILINGFIIYIGIALFFLLMEVLGWSDQIYLRLVNFIFVIYGVNRTLKANSEDGTPGYFSNLVSGIFTAVVSLALGILSFIGYIEYMGQSHGGSNEYLQRYVGSYIFGGGEPSLYQFVIGLTVEGVAASVVVSFALMQYWKDKVEKINKVDDVAHTSH
ncbi:hypothetical protein R1T16_03795 [Flavobacterium sp. DG1-102-2]|uniref:hypothetical protein n=1 Tax=Flavobacterium sp. DG1-102-2 TaxID=3081663 RepID=UPI00294A1FB9|nr:hypothetical protein [Flavobacterium sp. DG1-102-2]MDV6167534.1 hypothetical protein [Flavobacterium sp. DG1-102-2]